MLPRTERPTPPLPPSACTHVPRLTARPLSAGDVSTCYPKCLGTLRAHDAIADALEASAAGARNGAPATLHSWAGTEILCPGRAISNGIKPTFL